LEAIIMGKNQHVVPYDGSWAVRGAGNTRVSSIHPTQKNAINSAISVAQNKKSEVVIHRQNGRIRDKDSYGNDPFPPRDRKY
jgi:hypothetical protein